ncbi:MAG TPA: periplasmic heavy metal sensor [Thermodesulfobacteriota bacterium]|nr:periplasmic heavy metal sensor [Thermodesulfobacteriota bacterium]
MSKAIKIIFAASIILNILLAGVVIGAYSHGFRAKFSMRHDIDEALKDFPPDKRALVTGAMESLRENTKETKKEIRERRREVLEILSAPEFDPALYDKKVAELHALMNRLGNEFADTARDLALELDQDERKALAEVIMKRRGGKHVYKERRDDPPGKPGPGPADSEDE